MALTLDGEAVGWDGSGGGGGGGAVVGAAVEGGAAGSGDAAGRTGGGCVAGGAVGGGCGGAAAWTDMKRWVVYITLPSHTTPTATRENAGSTRFE